MKARRMEHHDGKSCCGAMVEERGTSNALAITHRSEAATMVPTPPNASKPTLRGLYHAPHAALPLQNPQIGLKRWAPKGATIGKDKY